MAKDIKQIESWGIKSGIGLFVFLLIIFSLLSMFYTVNAGERAILLTFGNPDMVPLKEGLHFKIPFVQSVVKMDIKTQKYESDLTAASKDLQDVSTKIAVNYHLVSEQVPTIYKEIGLDYSNKLIQPLEAEANKAIASQYTAEELITKREEVRNKMLATLKDKLVGRGIIVEEVSIINFQFSQSFTQAIELKVTAEQNALTAKNKLEQVKYEAQQIAAQAEGQKNAKIASAQGDAEAIRIVQEQLRKSPDYIEYYKLQRWTGVLPLYVGGGMPFISIPTDSQTK